MANKHFIGGATNTVVHTEADGTFHVEERMDVEPILDYTHAARNHRFSADALGGMMRHEGEIPFTEFQKECQRRGIPASLGTPMADEVIDYLLQANPKFRAAPATRDARIRMKGLR